MGMVHKKGDFSEGGRIYSGKVECFSRLGVQTSPGLKLLGLDPYVFQILINRTIHCNVDLFANRLNTTLEQFISSPDPEAIAHNALIHPLKGINGYAFPPFCLISVCLAKVQKEKSTILLVTPAWLAQPWYATILKLCIQIQFSSQHFPIFCYRTRGIPTL